MTVPTGDPVRCGAIRAKIDFRRDSRWPAARTSHLGACRYDWRSRDRDEDSVMRCGYSSARPPTRERLRVS